MMMAMTDEEIEKSMNNLDTIQVALRDKILKMEETCTEISAVLDNTQRRIDILKKEVDGQ